MYIKDTKIHISTYIKSLENKKTKERHIKYIIIIGSSRFISWNVVKQYISSKCEINSSVKMLESRTSALCYFNKDVDLRLIVNKLNVTLFIFGNKKSYISVKIDRLNIFNNESKYSNSSELNFDDSFL